MEMREEIIGNSIGSRASSVIASLDGRRRSCYVDAFHEKAVSAASTNHKSKLELEKGGQGGISLEREKRGDAR